MSGLVSEILLSFVSIFSSIIKSSPVFECSVFSLVLVSASFKVCLLFVDSLSVDSSSVDSLSELKYYFLIPLIYQK